MTLELGIHRWVGSVLRTPDKQAAPAMALALVWRLAGSLWVLEWRGHGDG